MTGPNNNNEVAWLFIVFVGGGIRVCRRRNCASDSDLRIRCSSTFIADLFLWIAVALTFQLNRSWTFSSLRQQHLSSAFAA